MSADTLYYFFSTTAQVLAAMCALLAVFTQFKLSELKNFMVGDGKATYYRMKNKEKGYELSDDDIHKTQEDRMRDATERKSLSDINNVLKVLAQERKNKGETLESEPRGPIYLLHEFENKLKQIADLKDLTTNSFIVSFVTILLSIVAIALADILQKYNCVQIVLAVFVFLGAVSAFILAFLGIKKGLKEIDGINKV